VSKKLLFQVIIYPTANPAISSSWEENLEFPVPSYSTQQPSYSSSAVQYGVAPIGNRACDHHNTSSSCSFLLLVL